MSVSMPMPSSENGSESLREEELPRGDKPVRELRSRRELEANCLSGGGEMGALMRSIDWSKTPIGAVDSWSPTLRTMASFLLANRFPLLLWWGPRFCQLYNDPYRPVLGDKHPRSMGQPGRECFPEIWRIIGPLIDTPFNGGPATWMEDIELEYYKQHNFLEEAHFTVAYSPVPDDTASTGIGGVLATVHEITEKVIAERRVAVLRDLGTRPAEAKTAEEACSAAAETLAQHPKDVPFALLYLIDADRKHARLAGAAGIGAAKDVAPLVIHLGEEASFDWRWPLAEALRQEAMQVVQDLPEKLPNVPSGPWADPPQVAAVLPIRSRIAQQFAGFLVLGVSSRLRFDDSYRDFYNLVASQVATAIANARAYEEERKRAEALAEIDRAKTVFFSNVSHEFRTPLTLMLGPLEDALANAHGVLPLGAARDLAISRRNSLRLLKLVNTMLDFSRIEAGRVQASYQPTDLAAFTSELANNFRSVCEKAGLRLIVDCAPLSRDEPVYVDHDMWEKIVLNLVSNAVKFTFKGEIELRLETAGGQARLTVRDTGVGIPSEELPRMFERFHRIEHNRGRTYEGTGIGLALVQELVKLHGGTVGVESVMGEGSRFTVAIPLGKAHLDPERIGKAAELESTAIRPAAFVEEALRWLPDESAANGDFPEAGGQMASGGELADTGKEPGQTGKARILWADDNADMRAYVSRLLGGRFDVQAVSDGEAALDAARAHPPDLILSDVMMPKLDGFGLLRAARADPQLREIPVILLSARAGEESRIEGIEVGADDYLVKPFSARELVARVRTQVKMARTRREAKAALRESEDRFRTLANPAPAMIWVTEPDASCSFFSRQWREYTGQHEETALGFGWLDALHPDDREESRRVLLEANCRREAFSLDCRVRRADGEYRWALNSGCPRFNSQGAFAGYTGSIIDVHERHEAAQASALLSAIVDSCDDAIISKDLNGVIRSWNKSAEWLFGYTAEEAIGQSITMLIPPDRLEEEPKILEQLRRGERIDHFETVRVRKDGSRLNISLTISPVKDADGCVVGASKVARDITERVRQEEALQETNAALRRANADLQQFAYSASHDLQEPLRMVSAYSELLQKKFAGQLGQNGDEYIRYIVHGAWRLEELLQDLRTYMLVSTGEYDPQEDADAGAILEKTLADLEVAIKDSGAAISRTALPRVRMYDFQLHQIFQNLIGNAICYRGSDPPRIHVAATQQGDEWLFSVQDNGIGIAPEFKEQIFGVFKRLHSSAEYPGTGMGLAICQRIIDRAGGRIWVESQPGYGSTFFFTIRCGRPRRERTAIKESFYPLGRG